MRVDKEAFSSVFMRVYVTYLIPLCRACDTTSGVVPEPDRCRPATSQIAPDLTRSCLEPHLLQESKSAPSRDASRTPTTHCHPRTKSSAGCAARSRIKTHDRSSGRTTTGRAPAHTGHRIPCACRSHQGQDKSASPRQSRTHLQPLQHVYNLRQCFPIEAAANFHSASVRQQH